VWPASVCFPAEGRITGSDDNGKNFHNIVLQIHYPRKDLARDYSTMIGYIETVGHAIRDYTTLGGSVEAIDGEIGYLFGEMAWAGIKTIGPQFKFTVKIRP
jgi:hypothetical protein